MEDLIPLFGFLDESEVATCEEYINHQPKVLITSKIKTLNICIDAVYC